MINNSNTLSDLKLCTLNDNHFWCLKNHLALNDLVDVVFVHVNVSFPNYTHEVLIFNKLKDKVWKLKY